MQQKVAAGIDAFYARLEREFYACCRQDRNRQWVELGVKRFLEKAEIHCRTCGLIWVNREGRWYAATGREVDILSPEEPPCPTQP